MLTAKDPLLVTTITVPIGFAFIGIAANWLSDTITWLSDIITAAITTIYSFSPALTGAAFAGLWQVLVIFGIHQGLVGVGITALVTSGSTSIFTLMLPTTFAQTGVVLAIWAKTIGKKLKNISLLAWIWGIFGVTKPDIYGVSLPRIKYFIVSCVISAIDGVAIGMSGIVASIMGGLGVFALPSYFAQDQKLLEFFIDEIKNGGYPVITPVIVTNTPDYTDVLAEDVMQLDDGDPFITIMA